MAKQAELDRAYMQCALAMSNLSHARRKKVGAILVSPDGGIIAEGVNGTPSGFDNACEDEYVRTRGMVMDQHIDQDSIERLKLAYPEMFSDDPAVGESFLVTKKEVLHAESNAIAKIACSTNTTRGATMYTTLSPCHKCALQIIQCKIARVVYAEIYRANEGNPQTQGLDLLRKAGIQVDELPLHSHNDDGHLIPRDEGWINPERDDNRPINYD